MPKFCITGKLDSTASLLSRPFQGEVTVERCERPIKSIELQLIRVETVGSAEGYARIGSEIQTLQIADGDIPKGLPVPIYMILPRLFTCPTIETPNFKVEFELNLVVLFDNDHLIKENIPITLHRC